MSVENMELWDSVCTTDPEMTKKVNQRGGFTAICAQYQLKNATEKWGPYGGTWGIKECSFHEVRNSNADIVELAIDAQFFYPEGSFPISSDIKHTPGNDSRKKLLTDVTTKALSKLGFNSDVFEGKFDDNKYLAELKAKKDMLIMPKCDLHGREKKNGHHNIDTGNLPPSDWSKNSDKYILQGWAVRDGRLYAKIGSPAEETLKGLVG